jgi:hypothetical protein
MEQQEMERLETARLSGGHGGDAQLFVLLSQDDMFLPVRIIGLRKIAPEMRAATLFTSERGLRDQPRDGNHVS